MPKVQSDIGAVAGAFRELFALIKLRIQGTEKRNLKAAASLARLYMKRTVKLFPKAKKDKKLSSYQDKFERKVI